MSRILSLIRGSAKSVTETVIGGLLITLILFFFDEVVLPKRNLTGEWRLTSTMLKSTYRPMINVKGYSKIEILQKGNELTVQEM